MPVIQLPRALELSDKSAGELFAPPEAHPSSRQGARRTASLRPPNKSHRSRTAVLRRMEEMSLQMLKESMGLGKAGSDLVEEGGDGDAALGPDGRPAPADLGPGKRAVAACAATEEEERMPHPNGHRVTRRPASGWDWDTAGPQATDILEFRPKVRVNDRHAASQREARSTVMSAGWKR